MVLIFFCLVATVKMFAKIVPIYLPTSGVLLLGCFIIFLTWYIHFLNFKYSYRCVVITHGGFNLHFTYEVKLCFMLIENMDILFWQNVFKFFVYFFFHQFFFYFFLSRFTLIFEFMVCVCPQVYSEYTQYLVRNMVGISSLTMSCLFSHLLVFNTVLFIIFLLWLVFLGLI